MNGARRLWAALEPLHAVVYFAPQVRQAFEAVGLTGFWRGYFAGRAAPLGPVGPGVVTAVFYGFHPDFVARALPDVWDRAAPEIALQARLDGVDQGLRAAGVLVDDPAIAPGVTSLHDALSVCAPAGRPLFAANADLPWPEAPHLALWHSATLLREHRGDGHVAALIAAEIGPCEAHVLRIAIDGSPIETIQPHRGWSDEDWSAAAAALRSRGWLDETGAPTVAGRDAHADLETHTDALASAPIAQLGDDLDDLIATIERVTAPLHRDGLIPYPNAIGAPRPAPTP